MTRTRPALPSMRVHLTTSSHGRTTNELQSFHRTARRREGLTDREGSQPVQGGRRSRPGALIRASRPEERHGAAVDRGRRRHAARQEADRDRPAASRERRGEQKQKAKAKKERGMANREEVPIIRPSPFAIRYSPRGGADERGCPQHQRAQVSQEGRRDVAARDRESR